MCRICWKSRRHFCIATSDERYSYLVSLAIRAMGRKSHVVENIHVIILTCITCVTVI